LDKLSDCITSLCAFGLHESDFPGKIIRRIYLLALGGALILNFFSGRHT